MASSWAKHQGEVNGKALVLPAANTALHLNPPGVAYLAPRDAKLRVLGHHAILVEKNLFLPKNVPYSQNFGPNIQNNSEN